VNVCVLVLAAGRARRFGSDKRVAMLPGRRRVIDTLLEQIDRSGLPHLVCLDSDDDALASELQQRRIPVHRCARAREGMGGTLAEGIGQLEVYDGALVSLADMPWIDSSTYQAVAARLTPANICVPTWQDKPGHPVGFGAAYFAELAALGGDTGARGLLEKYASAVCEVAVEDAAIHRDIDVPSDLRRVG